MGLIPLVRNRQTNNKVDQEQGDTDFYVENPFGKKKNHGHTIAIFTISKKVFTKRKDFLESSTLPVRLTRGIYGGIKLTRVEDRNKFKK